MEKQDKIYIAGHRGMVGSAIKRKLEQEGFTNIVARTIKHVMSLMLQHGIIKPSPFQWRWYPISTGIPVIMR